MVKCLEKSQSPNNSKKNYVMKINMLKNIYSSERNICSTIFEGEFKLPEGKYTALTLIQASNYHHNF
jgi:hypothetical protein